MFHALGSGGWDELSCASLKTPLCVPCASLKFTQGQTRAMLLPIYLIPFACSG